MADSSCAKKRTVLVYACSGGANVGEAADRAARQLMYDGDGTMFCVAGVGGEIDDMIDTVNEADVNLVIDGCDTDCAKACFDTAGVTNYAHLRVTDLGLEKVKPKAATSAEVDMVVAKAREMLTPATGKCCGS